MSHGTCPTVQIKTEPSEGNPSGIVVINEFDFDADTMELADPVEPVQDLRTPETNPETFGKPVKVVAPWASA